MEQQRGEVRVVTEISVTPGGNYGPMLNLLFFLQLHRVESLRI